MKLAWFKLAQAKTVSGSRTEWSSTFLSDPGTPRSPPEPVSVIIPHYGSYETLESCLNSIMAHTRGAEVIVADNNQLPSDFSDRFPDVKLLRCGGNKGFGYACNLGAKFASNQILVFMNNDVEVTQNWLGPLLAPLSQQSVGAACPLVVFRDNPDIVNAAGGDCDFLGLNWRRAIGARRNMKIENTFFWAPVECLVVRRKVFTKIGGFDESMFLLYEDVDLSWRMRMAGWNLTLVPQSVVLHKYMASTSRLPRTRLQYFTYRNRLRLLLKNYGARQLVRVLSVYMVLELMLLCWIIYRNEGSDVRPLLKAWAWNLRNWPNTLQAHQRAQSARTKSDDEVMQLMYPGIAGIHLVLGTMRHPVFETYFNQREASIRPENASRN